MSTLSLTVVTKPQTAAFSGVNPTTLEITGRFQHYLSDLRWTNPTREDISFDAPSESNTALSAVNLTNVFKVRQSNGEYRTTIISPAALESIHDPLKTTLVITLSSFGSSIETTPVNLYNPTQMTEQSTKKSFKKRVFSPRSSRKKKDSESLASSSSSSMELDMQILKHIRLILTFGTEGITPEVLSEYQDSK